MAATPFELQRRLRAEPQLVVVVPYRSATARAPASSSNAATSKPTLNVFTGAPGERGDQAGVDPARQQHADGRVGRQVRAHGGREPLLGLVRERGERLARARSPAGTGRGRA